MFDFNKIEVPQSIGKLKELFDQENTTIGYQTGHDFGEDNTRFYKAKEAHKSFFYELINAMEAYKQIAYNEVAEAQFLDWLSNYELDVIERDSRLFKINDKIKGHSLFVSAVYHVPGGFKKPTVELTFREILVCEKNDEVTVVYPYKITTFVLAKFAC